MERLTDREPIRNMAYLAKVKPNEQEVESPYPNTLACILESFDRLAAYEDTGLEPSEVAALRARCEAAEAELARFVQIDGDPFWHPTYGDPDSGGQNAGRYYYKDAGRGPQEGATAHERV